MKQSLLLTSMFLIMFTPVFSMAGDGSLDQQVKETVAVETPTVVSEVIVLEDGTEEVIISTPVSKTVHAFVDDRILVIKSDVQEKILAVVEEISQLEDKSHEGELQKQIETIKLDAEIAQLRIQMENAEDAQDFELAYKIRDEIEHLENQDIPSIGFPQEQPAP